MRGLEPRTLGVTDYDMDAPLKAIRRLMLESNGLITIAFKRALITEARVRADTDIAEIEESKIRNMWLTSPYCHIEPAMAYQLGLPILILCGKGVIQGGLLEKKGLSVPTCPSFHWKRKVSITSNLPNGMTWSANGKVLSELLSISKGILLNSMDIQRNATSTSTYSL